MRMNAEKSLLACGMGLLGATMAIGTVAQSPVGQQAGSRVVPGLNLYPRANDLRVEMLDGRLQLTGEVVKSEGGALAPAVSMAAAAADARFRPEEIPIAWVSPPRLPATVDDAAITAGIASKLAWSRHADGVVAEVHTQAGRVKLRGSTDSAAALAFAIQIASNTYGVVSVHNQLSLELAKPGPAQRVTEALREAWVALRLKAAPRSPGDTAVAAIPAGGSSAAAGADAVRDSSLTLAAKDAPSGGLAVIAVAR